MFIDQPDIIEEFTHGRQTLRIMREFNPVSPRDPNYQDNLWTLALLYSARDYNETGIKDHDYSTWDEMEQALKDDWGAIYTVPIDFHDNSCSHKFYVGADEGKDDDGITRYGRHMVGFAFVTEAQVQKCCGDDPKYRTAEFLHGDIEGELHTPNQWCEGDVYGFETVVKKTCSCCGNVSETQLGSVWGHYGTDWAANGLLDAAGWHKNEHGEIVPNTEEEDETEETETMQK